MIISDVLSQSLYFACALFCGIIGGIYYDILYTLRKFTNGGKVAEFFCDIIFFTLTAITFVIVMYRANGYNIKWYLIPSFFGGFCLQRYAFQKYVAMLTEKIYNIVAKLLKKINIFLSKKFSKKNKVGQNQDDGETAL